MLCGLWLLLGCGSARGQGAGLGISLGREPTGVSYPPPQYYAALEIYRTGELDRAFDAFEFAIDRTRRDINGHWIDAIPCYAMMAECQYKLGDLEGAMQSLDMVMKIAARRRGWLRRPVWTEVAQPQVTLSPKQYLWAEANAVNRIPMARAVKFYSGEVITEQRLAQGGRIEELNIKTVDVVEIMRGLAVASYRRRIILGPLAEDDALANQTLDSTKYPAEVDLPLARNLIGAMRATERFGGKQDERAVSDAQKYATFSGRVHPLSPLVGLCAASAMAGTDKPTAAVPLGLRVANQAASLGHFEWIGEALQLAAGCASANEAAAVQQAGQVAAGHLQRESRLAALHCLLASADAAITAGDVSSAQARLEEARALASRRDVLQPRLDAYGAYVSARLATRRGGPNAATPGARPWSESLAQVMNFATNNRLRKRNLISMPRLYQLQRVRNAMARGLEGLSADVVFARHAADPPVEVWRRDPVDALAGLIANRDALRVARLRTAASRDSGRDVVARIEDLQTGRVRSQLPLGGRVLTVRALARMPDELLTPEAVEYRNAAPKPIRDLRAAIQAAQAQPPGAAPDPAAAAAQWNRLEADAWAIALDRHALPAVMPHPLDEKQPLSELPEDTGLLTFAADGNLIHAALAHGDKVSYWSIKGGNRLGKEIAAVLRGIGASQSRGARLPEDSSWKDDAVKLRDRLIMPGTGPLLQGPLAGIEHLVVIPDGLLWYLPFEILPVEDRDTALLGDAVRLSYAATPALALHPTAPPAANPAIALTDARFFAPRDMERNESLVQTILDSVDQGAVIRLPSQAALPTSRSGEVAGHLIVGEPTAPASGSVLDAPLASHDVAAGETRLRHWLAFPPRVPASVFLAGFRSNLDRGQPVSGQEFLPTIAALQYSGVRDVLLSRWAVGGESTALLIREYAQELPFSGAGKAFERARSVLRRSELAPAGEPTLSGSDQDRLTLTGDEPFFWSTYLHAGGLN